MRQFDGTSSAPFKGLTGDGIFGGLEVRNAEADSPTLLCPLQKLMKEKQNSKHMVKNFSILDALKYFILQYA